MGSRQREIDDLIKNIEETDNKIARRMNKPKELVVLTAIGEKLDRNS